MKASLLTALFLLVAQSVSAELVGHWTLQGDAKDYSGHGNHGTSYGQAAERGEFNGRDARITVAPSNSLHLGTGDFSISAWISTESDPDDVFGDILEWYDPAQRKGITLGLTSSGSGYSGQGNDRQVVFGIDNAQLADWTDCGRPSPTSRYISNSMLVYDGNLYVATTDARDEKDWCHVFSYQGEQKWKDCGRVGAGKTTGVGPLLVHNGQLYAVTRTYDWTRISTGGYDPGRMYRYAGGTNWIDCGQPGACRTWNTACSYKGNIYVGGGPETWSVFVWKGGTEWEPSKIFSKDGDRRCFPHPMSRYDGRLFTGWPAIHSFDGSDWTFAGLPGPMGTNAFLQVHSLAVFRGDLVAGTWPEGAVARYRGGEQWENIGRVGEDGTEVNALVVYNGKLYGGSIPRAEVCRYDGQPRWTSLRQFHSATNNWQPGLPGKARRKQVNEWGRVTTLAIHRGKLFAGLGNCTSAVVDTVSDPNDVLGKVYYTEAGRCISCDRDIGAGWKHIVAVRKGGELGLFIDGEPVARSARFNPNAYDLTTDRPLRIGVGQTDYFKGRIADVRIYNHGLSPREISVLHLETKR